jgi:hypothetical protein
VPRLVYLASARRDFEDILEYITKQSGNLVVGKRFADVLRTNGRYRCPEHSGGHDLIFGRTFAASHSEGT